MFRSLAVSFLLTLVLFVAGCSDLLLNNSVPKITAVSGKLMDGDTPVANAKILMLPLEKSDGSAPARWSYAETNEEGRFTMRFNSKRYGAHIGENLVLISTAVREELEQDEPDDQVKDGEKNSTTESSDQEEETGGDPEISGNEIDQDESSDPELKLTDNIKTAADKPKPWKLIKEETVPDIYNRRSELTFDVQPQGNTSVVFQIGADPEKKAGSVETSADLAAPKS